jgi:hypothetical protein
LYRSSAGSAQAINCPLEVLAAAPDEDRHAACCSVEAAVGVECSCA